MIRIAVLGAGGFAREVRWLIEEINSAQETFQFVGYLVSDLAKIGEHDSRSEVRGDFDWLTANARDVDALAFGIGNGPVKARIAAELREKHPDLSFPPLLHPTARFDRPSCHVGEGVVVCAGVIATVGVRFEDFSMVNLACTIGHEAVIGKHAVLNPTVNVSGGVVIGSEVLVGTGAQILQYVRIGNRAVVGAGAVVSKDVAPDVTVVGIPAKPLRD